jgi:hypothetical protein
MAEISLMQEESFHSVGDNMSTLESNSIAPIIDCINESLKNSTLKKKKNKVIKFVKVSQEELSSNKQL